MVEITPRLPKFKNCTHEHRYIRTLKGFDVFYCIKCLLFTAKLPDLTKKQILEQYKKYKNETNKRRLFRLRTNAEEQLEDGFNE